MAATAITTLFWDIGGVILTNGWGRSSRKEATKVFDFDWLVDTGAISPGDLHLFQFADTPEEAFAMLKAGLTEHHLEPAVRPAVANADDHGPEFAQTAG